jgi:flagellar motor protein MotB
MPMELSEKDLREQAEDRRQLLEEVQRKKKAGGFQNGAEALQAFRDLFDSDEEMEEFGDYLQQMREEERARYRD